jgi:hypothetical protein
VVDEIFNYERTSSVAGTKVRNGRVRCAQAPDIKPESPMVVSLCCSKYQRAGSRRNLSIPTLKYSKNPSKVDCWRRNSIIGGEDNEVSCAVSCSVVQM